MIKSAIAMILAALATTSTATAPVANATETKINSVALEYATDFRATTAEVTGIEQNPNFTTTTFCTPDGNEWAVCDELNPESSYLVVFDTMGTADLTDDEVIAMVPIQK